MHNQAINLICLFIFLMGFASGSGLAEFTGDCQLDSEIFAAEPDPAKIVILGGEGNYARFPTNQIILLMAKGTPRTIVEEIAAGIAGHIVGQIPIADIYQLEIPAKNIEELNASIRKIEAYTYVESASYNYMAQKLDDCLAESDNSKLMGDARCQFAHTDYFSALTFFDKEREHIRLYPVKVAVLDTGLAKDNGEFSDVIVLSLHSSSGRNPYDDDGHGTMVTSVIAADNNGRGMNGIATRFLGNNLTLMVTEGNDISTMENFVYFTWAVNRGASIVNFSGGYGYKDAADRKKARDQWRRFLAEFPNVLLVVAAPNDDNMELKNETIAPPAGLQLPNVVTVGGTRKCHPEKLRGAHGSLIDIYAPSEGVNVVDRSGHTVPATGNSFAAPQVASLAAILKSINPGIGPQDIKFRYLIINRNTFQGNFSFFPPILQVLVDTGIPDPLLDLIDQDRNHEFDSVGDVISRICGGLNIRVAGHGWFSYTGDEAGGSILPGKFGIAGGQKDQNEDLVSSVGITCGNCTFDVNRREPYPIGGDTTILADTAGLVFQDGEHGGVAISGELKLCKCRIVKRGPIDNRPFELLVEGRFSGIIQMSDTPKDIHKDNFEGSFRVPFIVGPVFGSIDEFLVEALEKMCEEGLKHYK